MNWARKYKTKIIIFVFIWNSFYFRCTRAMSWRVSHTLTAFTYWTAFIVKWMDHRKQIINTTSSHHLSIFDCIIVDHFIVCLCICVSILFWSVFFLSFFSSFEWTSIIFSKQSVITQWSLENIVCVCLVYI